MKLCGEKLRPRECVKKYGIKIDKSLSWQHINDVSDRINSANSLFFKLNK